MNSKKVLPEIEETTASNTTGRPIRDRIINEEDQLNLRILLNTETDFDVFLSKL